MADEPNGADTAGHAGKWTECVLGLYGDVKFFGTNVNPYSGQTGNCPSPSQLTGWRLNVKKMELDITAGANFNVPEVPSCKELAQSNNLSHLATACPN